MGRESCAAKKADALVRDSRGWMRICVPASKTTRTELGVMSGKFLWVVVSITAVHWMRGGLTLSVQPLAQYL